MPKSSSGRASPQVFDEDEIGLKAPDFGIKFPELKPGVSLRSKIMILPASGRKRRTEIIETAIKEFGISTHPIPTEEVTMRFNKLRSDILKLHDVRQAFQHTECELVALIKKFNETCPGTPLPKGVESIGKYKEFHFENFDKRTLFQSLLNDRLAVRQMHLVRSINFEFN